MQRVGICLAGKVEIDLNLITNQFQISSWIAVDGGYNHLQTANIEPEITIGDMDSIEAVPKAKIQFPSEKDETDYELAINYINDKYPKVEIIVCGVYDDYRLEHFISNLKMMQTNMTYVTKHNIIKQFEAGEYEITPTTGGFSLFAKENVENLNINNAKYELDNYYLSINDNLTISNEFIDKNLKISFDTGIIQMYLTNN